MTSTDPMKRYREIVAASIEGCALAPEDLLDAHQFRDDLGADSLDSIEMVCAIEEEFGVHLPDATIEEAKSVGELGQWLRDQLAARAGDAA